MSDAFSDGVLILDLAHENAALRGALVILLDAVRSGVGLEGAEALAVEVLQRFAAEIVERRAGSD